MEPTQAAAFYAAAHALVAPHATAGRIELEILGTVVWGEPDPA